MPCPIHLHLACSLPITLAASDFMHKIKGGSAHFINHGTGGALAWQPGYGVLTFAARELPRVVTYIERQEEHHAAGKLSPKMEQAGGPAAKAEVPSTDLPATDPSVLTPSLCRVPDHSTRP